MSSPTYHVVEATLSLPIVSRHGPSSPWLVLLKSVWFFLTPQHGSPQSAPKPPVTSRVCLPPCTQFQELADEEALLGIPVTLAVNCHDPVAGAQVRCCCMGRAHPPPNNLA